MMGDEQGIHVVEISMLQDDSNATFSLSQTSFVVSISSKLCTISMHHRLWRERSVLPRSLGSKCGPRAQEVGH